MKSDEDPPETDYLIDYYRGRLYRDLMTPLWIQTFADYAVHDTRPRWRRNLSAIKSWLYWRTAGRFRAWLHRNCGDY